MGSGTTAVASKMTNRKFIGFEIVQDYVNFSKKRLSEVPIGLDKWIDGND